jgi:hypothetical protein
MGAGGAGDRPRCRSQSLQRQARSCSMLPAVRQVSEIEIAGSSSTSTQCGTL